MRPLLRSAEGRSKRAHIIGVVVSETTSEMRIAADSEIANSPKQPPYDAAHQQDRMGAAMGDGKPRQHRESTGAHKQAA